MNDDYTLSATPLATEIHIRFRAKMAPGGEIDRIFTSGEPFVKVLPKSEAEIALIKKQIEIQLAEYDRAIRDAAVWYRDWMARERRNGFRCVRKGRVRD